MSLKRFNVNWVLTLVVADVGHHLVRMAIRAQISSGDVLHSL
jgi:hypothetical protein